MDDHATPHAPPFCPNPACPFHKGDITLWRWKRAGTHARLAPPHRVQRYRCRHCGRHFSEQTFRTTYWLRRPQLLMPVLHRLLGCSAFRQIAREHSASPQTIARLAGRLGRHCLLHHCATRPAHPASEPLCLDSFQSFEWSQYHPTLFHLLAGTRSHFCHGFTDSELRRSGRMTRAQKRLRASIEASLGVPDPRSTEKEVAALLALALPQPIAAQLHTDEHHDYPRALRRLPRHRWVHRTISSRAARTSSNPLFPVNLLDLLIRHCGANHKRETIAFSRRRAGAIDRLWLLITWRNWMKHFSERARQGSPAMRLGLTDRLLRPGELLRCRLFPTRIDLPERWRIHYTHRTPTRAIAHPAAHHRVFAF